MATWDGHLISSVFFVLQGLWWTTLSIWYKMQPEAERKSLPNARRCLVSCTRPSTKASKTGCLKSWIPQPFLPSVPIEPIAKVVACSVGIFIEALTAFQHDENGMRTGRVVVQAFRVFNNSGDFSDVGKFQHVTMYSAFALSGLIDLLILVVKLPDITSPFFFTIAFFSQGVLFLFHLGHSVLNGTYHKLQLPIIISCIIFSFLRTLHVKSFLVNVALGCSILLQGTWFFQSLFLTFKDGEVYWQLARKPEQHSEKLEHMVPMYLSGVFVWHMMAIAITVVILWSVMSFIGNRKGCRCLKRKAFEWQEEQSECNENLIENKAISDENVEVEVETVIS